MVLLEADFKIALNPASAKHPIETQKLVEKENRIVAVQRKILL